MSSFLRESAELSKGEEVGWRETGGGGGDGVRVSMAVNGDGVGSPLDVRLDGVKPWFPKDDVKVLKWSSVEGGGVLVGREREGGGGENEGAGLDGTVGEEDGIRVGFVGGGDMVLGKIGGSNEIAVTSGINEEAGGVTVKEAVEHKERCADGVEV